MITYSLVSIKNSSLATYMFFYVPVYLRTMIKILDNNLMENDAVYVDCHGVSVHNSKWTMEKMMWRFFQWYKMV